MNQEKDTDTNHFLNGSIIIPILIGFFLGCISLYGWNNVHDEVYGKQHGQSQYTGNGYQTPYENYMDKYLNGPFGFNPNQGDPEQFYYDFYKNDIAYNLLRPINAILILTNSKTQFFVGKDEQVPIISFMFLWIFYCLAIGLIIMFLIYLSKSNKNNAELVNITPQASPIETFDKHFGTDLNSPFEKNSEVIEFLIRNKTFLNLCAMFSTCFDEQFGEQVLSDIDNKVFSLQTRNPLLIDKRYKRNIPNFDELLVIVNSSSIIPNSSSENISCALIILLSYWNMEVGTPLNISNDASLNKLFFEILKKCSKQANNSTQFFDNFFEVIVKYYQFS